MKSSKSKDKKWIKGKKHQKGPNDVDSSRGNSFDLEILQSLEQFQKEFTKAQQEGGEFPDQIDNERVWRTILDPKSASNEIMFSLLYTYAQFYNSVVPEFSSPLPEFVTKDLESIKAMSYSTNMINCAKSYIRVLSLFDMENIVSIFEIAVKLVSLTIKHNPSQVPKAILSAFDDVVVEDLPRNTFKGLVEFFKEMVNSKIQAQVIYILAYLALDLVQVEESLEGFIKATISNALEAESDIIYLMSGLLLLKKYSPHFLIEPESAPSTDLLIEKIFPLLISNNIDLSALAHKTAKSLIKNRIFKEEEVLGQILSLFEQYPKTHYTMFFELIHVVLYPVNDCENIDYNPEMTSLIPIKDFVVDKLSNKADPIVKGHCIDVISEFMCIKQSFVSDVIDLAYEEAKRMINNKIASVFHLISSFLVAIYESNSDLKKEIESFIPKLCEVLPKDKPLKIKERQNLAIDIGSICKTGKIAPPKSLIQFASNSAEFKTPTESLRASCLVNEVVHYLDSKSFETIFSQIYQHVINANNEKALHFYVKTMRKILKLGFTKEAAMFLNIILTGRHPLFRNRPPWVVQEFTQYLITFVKSRPPEAPKLFDIYFNMLEHKPPPEENDEENKEDNDENKENKDDADEDDDTLPNNYFLIAVMSFLKTKNLSESQVKKLYGYIFKILKNGRCSEAVYDKIVLVISAIDTLKVIFDVSPRIVSPLDDKIDLVAKFVNNVDFTERMARDSQIALHIAPSVCDFVLDVYAKDTNVKVNDDILTTVFHLLPFPADVPNNESILGSLMTLMLRKEKFDHLKVKICRVLASYLLLSKRDLREFQFSKTCIDKMVFSLKTVLKEDPDCIDSILKHFPNKKRDVPKLKALIE